MTKAELRRAMRERKRALKRTSAEARRQARAQLDGIPAVRRARTRRRVKRAAGLGVLVLLLMLLRCECEQPPPPQAPEEAPKAAAPEEPAPKEPKPPAKVTKKSPPLKGRVQRQPRAEFQGELTAPPSWLEEFRLQVAARSPRLAECFTGADRPGGLRWSVAVNAQSGAVSDHELEAVGAGGSIDGKQRECLIQTLSAPAYRLKLPNAEPASGVREDLPSRIGMVIEF